MQVTMQEKDLDDRADRYVAATVQPSNFIQRGLGVFVNVNDHYVLGQEASAGAGAAVAALRDNFEKSQQRSDWIVEQIMKLSRD